MRFGLFVPQGWRHDLVGIVSAAQRATMSGLTAMQKCGLAYAIHYFPEAAYDRSGIEMFEREVMPALA